MKPISVLVLGILLFVAADSGEGQQVSPQCYVTAMAFSPDSR
jgi:hypothetical protein